MNRKMVLILISVILMASIGFVVFTEDKYVVKVGVNPQGIGNLTGGHYEGDSLVFYLDDFITDKNEANESFGNMFTDITGILKIPLHRVVGFGMDIWMETSLEKNYTIDGTSYELYNPYYMVAILDVKNDTGYMNVANSLYWENRVGMGYEYFLSDGGYSDFVYSLGRWKYNDESSGMVKTTGGMIPALKINSYNHQHLLYFMKPAPMVAWENLPPINKAKIYFSAPIYVANVTTGYSNLVLQKKLMYAPHKEVMRIKKLWFYITIFDNQEYWRYVVALSIFYATVSVLLIYFGISKMIKRTYQT